MKKEYHVIGGMAGSSMDGLDLAYVKFKLRNNLWSFEFCETLTVDYPPNLFHDLKNATDANSSIQNKLDEEFGVWIASQINLSMDLSEVNLLAIHGHTILHIPDKGVSWQLGSGSVIADKLKVLTVTDFRTEDVRIGGQGAPLVPFGDFELFSEYDACLNLGGIANISIRELKIAGDICPCNQVLNFYANQLGQDFDDGGRLAKSGKVNFDLLNQLSLDPYFKSSFPKSLPNGYISEKILALVDPIDGLRAYTEFIAVQIAEALGASQPQGKVLITGGGAFNQFLIQLIKKKLQNWDIDVPSNELISFKEALIFGFLGLKKYLGEINVLSSVTGAKHDTSSGVIHTPK